MSKASQAANDLRAAEAAGEQIGERETEPPTSGTQAADEARTKVKTTVEAAELPSFDGAMAMVQALEQGDNDAANRLVNGEVGKPGLGSKKMKYVIRDSYGLNSKLGWHCRPQEKGPLTLEQSQALADAINSKLDTDKMHAAAEQRRAEREKQATPERASDKTNTEAEKLNKEITEALELVPDIQDLSNLNSLVYHCARYKLLVVEKHGEHWKIMGLEGNELSHQLAKAINSKKNKFLEEIRDNNRRIDRILQQIEYSPNSVQLDMDAWDFHRKRWIEKKFTKEVLPPNNWIANPIKGKQGSKDIAEALNKRREELIKSEARAAEERKEQQRKRELERIRNKTSR